MFQQQATAKEGILPLIAPQNAKQCRRKDPTVSGIAMSTTEIRVSLVQFRDKKATGENKAHQRLCFTRPTTLT